MVKYQPEKLEREPQVGLVNGLAWTSVGGELLEVEASVMEGTGKIMPTGNLGDVMKESCQAAISFIRSHAKELGVDPTFYQNRDIHIHFPEGAVPKDGPSAGIAITTAIVSALTDVPVRRDIAMTGEVTIRGRVLPIGGLREKTMAAFRNGIHTVIIPEDNRKDLEEIDQTVRQGLHFVTVSNAAEVLEEALIHLDSPQNKPEQAARPAREQRGSDCTVLTHHTPAQDPATLPYLPVMENTYGTFKTRSLSFPRPKRRIFPGISCRRWSLRGAPMWANPR